MSDWNPRDYLLFMNERSQPAIDLIMRISVENPKRILDVGCGTGNITSILSQKWPEAEVIGIDNSPNMLQQAINDHPEMKWINQDASKDLSHLGKFDIIFSNAVLQWIPDSRPVLKHLFEMLNPGGALAVQVPFTEDQPSHISMRKLFAKPEWKKYYDMVATKPKYRSADFFYDTLIGLSDRMSIWQTEYIHLMDNIDALLDWNKASALRQFLDALPDEKTRNKFLSEFKAELEMHYKPGENGTVLYPFKRLFFVMNKR